MFKKKNPIYILNSKRNIIFFFFSKFAKNHSKYKIGEFFVLTLQES